MVYTITENALVPPQTAYFERGFSRRGNLEDLFKPSLGGTRMVAIRRRFGEYIPARKSANGQRYGKCRHGARQSKLRS